MRAIAPDAENLRLLTAFDPAAQPGWGVPDPWYGPEPGYHEVYDMIDAACDKIIEKAAAKK